MKTKEELSALKNEVEALGKKLAELSDDELEQVAGGNSTYLRSNNGKFINMLLPGDNVLPWLDEG